MAEREECNSFPTKPGLGERITKKISEFFGAIAAVVCIVMTIFVTISVICRYFFNYPILGADEFQVYMFLLTALLGVGLCAAKEKHLRVEILVDYFPKRVRKFFDITNDILMIVTAGIITYASVIDAMESRHLGLASSITHLPRWPFQLIIPLGYSALLIVVLMLLFKRIRGRAEQ